MGTLAPQVGGEVDVTWHRERSSDIRNSHVLRALPGSPEAVDNFWRTESSWCFGKKIGQMHRTWMPVVENKGLFLHTMFLLQQSMSLSPCVVSLCSHNPIGGWTNTLLSFPSHKSPRDLRCPMAPAAAAADRVQSVAYGCRQLVDSIFCPKGGRLCLLWRQAPGDERKKGHTLVGEAFVHGVSRGNTSTSSHTNNGARGSAKSYTII